MTETSPPENGLLAALQASAEMLNQSRIAREWAIINAVNADIPYKMIAAAAKCSITLVTDLAKLQHPRELD